MAKGFKQASGEMNNEKQPYTETSPIEEIKEAPKPSGSLKFGKGFSVPTAEETHIKPVSKPASETASAHTDKIPPRAETRKSEAAEPNDERDITNSAPDMSVHKKNKSHRSLIAGIVAAVIIAVAVPTIYFIATRDRGVAISGMPALRHQAAESEGTSSANSSSSTGAASSDSANSNSVTGSASLSSSLEKANKVFDIYSSPDDIYDTQNVSILGSGNSLLYTIKIPADMNSNTYSYIGTETQHVDSERYSWPSPYRGELEIAYGNAGDMLDGILSTCYGKVYPEISTHYVKAQSPETKSSRSFRQVCKEVREHRNEVYKMDKCEISDDGGTLRVETKEGYSLSEQYYLDDNVYAATIVSTATKESRQSHNTTGSYAMIKAINCGDKVKILYYSVSYLGKIRSEYSEEDMKHFAEIEYIMRKFD